MTMPDLPVEGLQARPGTSDHQFDSAGRRQAHRHGRGRRRNSDQELDAAETSTHLRGVRQAPRSGRGRRTRSGLVRSCSSIDRDP